MVIYKIEVPANRYDLLCMEGLVMGLLVFQQKCSAPVFQRVIPDNMLEVYTQPATADVRPFVIGAVLRGIVMTPDRYQSFIDLQALLCLDIINVNVIRFHSVLSFSSVDWVTEMTSGNYFTNPQYSRLRDLT